jgi:hypothetical protein
MTNIHTKYQYFNEIVEAMKSKLIQGLNAEHFDFTIEICPVQKDKLAVRIRAGESTQFTIRTGEFPNKS